MHTQAKLEHSYNILEGKNIEVWKHQQYCISHQRCPMLRDWASSVLTFIVCNTYTSVCMLNNF